MECNLSWDLNPGQRCPSHTECSLSELLGPRGPQYNHCMVLQGQNLGQHALRSSWNTMSTLLRHMYPLYRLYRCAHCCHTQYLGPHRGQHNQQDTARKRWILQRHIVPDYMMSTRWWRPSPGPRSPQHTHGKIHPHRRHMCRFHMPRTATKDRSRYQLCLLCSSDTLKLLPG
jgi:hypothetical protein